MKITLASLHLEGVKPKSIQDLYTKVISLMIFELNPDMTEAKKCGSINFPSISVRFFYCNNDSLKIDARCSRVDTASATAEFLFFTHDITSYAEFFSFLSNNFFNNDKEFAVIIFFFADSAANTGRRKINE